MAKAKKKAKRRDRHFWVTRDADAYAAYKAYKNKPIPNLFRSTTQTWLRAQQAFCPYRYNLWTGRSVHLKPGGGPIKVMLVKAR